jgi:hypothetical protein
MAGISTLEGFDYKGQLPNFSRDLFATVADMVAFSENYLPDVFITQVVENGKTYKYQRSNIVDADLGKWRELEGGGSADLSAYYKRTEVDTLLEDKVDKELGKSLTTNDFTDAYRDMVDANKLALETLNGDETVDGSVKKSVTACLEDSKTYTDEQIELMKKSGAIVCDEKPVYEDGTITYIKDGETKTTDSLGSWFYYTEDEKLKQTIWIVDDDGDVNEKTVVSAGGVNFGEYVSKVTDVVDTYTGAEADTTKIPNIASMQALEAKVQGNIDGKVDNTYDVSKAGNALVVGEDGKITTKDTSVLGGNAEAVAYENTDYPELSNVDKALDKILAKIYYVEPKINSFTMSPATTEYEIGTVVSGLAFSWAVNKDIISQSLTDCTIEVDDRTATYGADLKNTKTFTLTVSDGEKSATSSKTIKFLNKAYWGSAPEPADYTSEFILALSNSKLASGKNGTYTMTVGAGEYGYLVLPTSFGTVTSCWIGGFEVTLLNCGSIAHTNASGNTSSYTIYRTERYGLGAISMEIK